MKLLRKLSPALSLLLCVTLLNARQDRLSCGTHGDKTREQLHLHRQAKRERAQLKRNAAAAVPLTAVHDDIGNVAVIQDSDGSILSRRNSFNLNRRTLRFKPATGARYTVDLADDSYQVLEGTSIVLDDDDSQVTSLPFAFPFFGRTYDRVWINSDGNLTFNAGDGATTDRSLGRFSSGSPRIAALFRDLDPTRARGKGVTVNTSGAGWTVSWDDVPEFRSAGTGPLQRFQIRLFPDGTIEFAYGSISTQSAVVGISAGAVEGKTNVVSFLNANGGTEYGDAVAERFTNLEEIDVVAAAHAFYKNHDDAYDYLVFYNDQGIQADDGAVAYEITLRNNRMGYGDEPVDIGQEAGSKRRLQAIMNMGPLSQYPADPDGRVPARFTVGDTPVTTLAHEAGHLFLAFASVRNEDNERIMLNANGAHWHFLFNSDASLMEGNRIRDNGPNAVPRFQTTGAVEHFSALDQYLMGLRPAEEVPDSFVITNARGTKTSGLPQTGVTLEGQRRDVRVDEIVASEGRRIPDHTVSQRRFRFAFVLVTSGPQAVSTANVERIDAYRKRFEQYFSQSTDGRASADTSLRRALDFSLWPAAGVVAGAAGTASIALSAATAIPVTVLLRASSGNVELPPSVTIPAGSREAMFSWRGLRSGTDEIRAEPEMPDFETAWARVQVTTPERLRVVIASGNEQQAIAGRPLSSPVRIRVTDSNELPYPGVTLTASVTGGGRVDRTVVTTDREGVAEFRWTPGMGVINELTASVNGGASVVATALGRPALAAASVVNAASFQSGLVPGGIATIFGANFRTTGTSVILNGRTLPVLYSDARQVNFIVPESTPTGRAELVVRAGTSASDAVQVPVRALQPGIFFDAGSGYGAVLTAGTAQVTQIRPVARGEMIEIYSTGLGAVEQSASGHRTTIAQPQVFVGGMPATVSFSGLVPGFTGLYQINAQVPANAPSGTVSLVVGLGAERSNEVRVAVR